MGSFRQNQIVLILMMLSWSTCRADGSTACTEHGNRHQGDLSCAPSYSYPDDTTTRSSHLTPDARFALTRMPATISRQNVGGRGCSKGGGGPRGPLGAIPSSNTSSHQDVEDPVLAVGTSSRSSPSSGCARMQPDPERKLPQLSPMAVTRLPAKLFRFQPRPPPWCPCSRRLLCRDGHDFYREHKYC